MIARTPPIVKGAIMFLMLTNVAQLGIHGLLAWLIGLLVAVAVHEYGHARAAYALGDTTAADAGRMTLNPFKHLSLWGSLFLLLFGFGWSQPVPVDLRNFRLPRRDALLTAFAGPAANVVTAAAVGLVAQVLPEGTRLPALAAVVVFVNLLLAFFNLVPIPPLDGASVLTYLLERQPLVLLQLQRQGLFLLIGLLLVDSVAGGRVLGTLVGQPVSVLSRLFLGGASVF